MMVRLIFVVKSGLDREKVRFVIQNRQLLLSVVTQNAIEMEIEIHMILGIPKANQSEKRRKEKEREEKRRKEKK
jgi:hypothetical protein